MLTLVGPGNTVGTELPPAIGSGLLGLFGAGPGLFVGNKINIGDGVAREGGGTSDVIVGTLVDSIRINEGAALDSDSVEVEGANDGV
jgi:hypothetical protein